jgi:uncharacterized repeat protein (TIGR01451 family)
MLPPGQGPDPGNGFLNPYAPWTSPREPVDPPAPLVTIRVRAPAKVEAGKEIEYRLVVENQSRSAAHHVLVRDRLGAGAEYVKATPEPTEGAPASGPVPGTTTSASGARSATAGPKAEAGRRPDLLWQFGTLKPSERREVVLVVRPTGSEDVQNSAYVQFEHGQSVRTQVAHPELRLEVSAPARALLYDAVTFRLKVTNTGTVAAKDVVLEEVMPDEFDFMDSKPSTGGKNPLTWKLGTLRPGESRNVEYQAAVRKAGTFTDRVTATSGSARKQANASITVGEGRLEVVKTGPSRRLVKRPATYRIIVSNPGTMPVTGVEVTDELPAGITCSYASAGSRIEGNQVRWVLGTLAPGARQTVEVVTRAAEPGTFTNVVRASADRGLLARSHVETHFDAPAGPAVEIDVPATRLEVGRTVPVTIRLLNPGQTPASGVGLAVSVLSGGLKLLGGRGQTTGHQDGQRVEFSPVQSLAAGGEATWTVEVQAEKAGEARLRVELVPPPAGFGKPATWEEVLPLVEPARLSPTSKDVDRSSPRKVPGTPAPSR